MNKIFNERVFSLVLISEGSLEYDAHKKRETEKTVYRKKKVQKYQIDFQSSVSNGF